MTLRLYSIYGPWEDPSRLIPTLIGYGLNGRLPPLVSPKTARDFVYVDDAVEAMLRVAAMKPIRRGAVYNVCTGVQIDLGLIVEVARRLMNLHEEPVWSSIVARPWDTDVWVGAPYLMKEETGWVATTRFETGFQNTIEWFRNTSRSVRENYNY